MIRLLAVLGLLGLFLALDLAVWHRSIELIGAGLATVLANTQIVFVGLIAWAVHRERPTALAFGMIPSICLVYHHLRAAMMELKKTGDYAGLEDLGVLTGM